MSSKSVSNEAKQEFNRGMLRSAYGSMFFAALTRARDKDNLKLGDIAKRLGVHKSVVSKWFGGEPNWRINTIADLALALDLELVLKARHKKTGEIFTPYGVEPPPARILESDSDFRDSKRGTRFDRKPKFDVYAGAGS